jgi:hypothetical protein
VLGVNAMPPKHTVKFDRLSALLHATTRTCIQLPLRFIIESRALFFQMEGVIHET